MTFKQTQETLSNYTTHDTFIKSILEKGIHYYTNDSLGLTILKYSKKHPHCNLEDQFTMKCRGLVVETATRKIVSVPPEKSYRFECFSSYVQNWNDVIVEEFVDGTMINVFNYQGEWHISTRSNIGANCRWFSDKKFSEMFDEAKGSLDFNKLDVNCNYSFVLRHPENRIVKSYNVADLVLVQVATLGENNIILQNISNVRDELNSRGMEITIPKRYINMTLEKIINLLGEMDYQEQGLVFKYNGMRSKLRNEKYNYVKGLRGNNPKTFYNYIELRNSKLVKKYISYFPEYEDEFNDYRDKIHRMTGLLHHCYVNYFIRKTISRDTIPYELIPLIYALHTQHKTLGIKVTFDYAKNYFNNLPIKKIIFVVNYQKNKEFHKSKMIQTTNIEGNIDCNIRESDLMEV